MNNIKIRILNPETVKAARDMAICAARLTQHGEEISNMDDFIALHDKSYSHQFLENLTLLPHPTLQKFSVINVAVVGASRRFLAQITRHQNEVKFMSASLQYSDYTDAASFCVPYEIIKAGYSEQYIAECQRIMRNYKSFSDIAGHDAAGYVAPQGLRNVLIISATPFEWKHMINQRICRRNTSETRFVMLMIWKELFKLDPILFSVKTTGAFCQQDKCLERRMSCGNSLENMTPDEILKTDFSIIYKGEKNED